MHFNKKILFLLIIFIFFSLTGAQESGKNDWKTTEIYYRCRLETENPLWHLLFSIFVPDSQDFFWREKTGCDEKGAFREIVISNKNREIVRLFGRNDDFGAKMNFGGKYESKELDASQAKVWFDVQDFIRSAKPGDIYRADYKTAKSDYKILTETRKSDILLVREKSVNALYFEAKVWKKSEKYLQAQFWVARGGIMDGQIIKFILKKPHLLTIIFEIADKN